MTTDEQTKAIEARIEELRNKDKKDWDNDDWDFFNWMKEIVFKEHSLVEMYSIPRGENSMTYVVI